MYGCVGHLFFLFGFDQCVQWGECCDKLWLRYPCLDGEGEVCRIVIEGFLFFWCWTESETGKENGVHDWIWKIEGSIWSNELGPLSLSRYFIPRNSISDLQLHSVPFFQLLVFSLGFPIHLGANIAVSSSWLRVF